MCISPSNFSQKRLVRAFQNADVTKLKSLVADCEDNQVVDGECGRLLTDLMQQQLLSIQDSAGCSSEVKMAFKTVLRQKTDSVHVHPSPALFDLLDHPHCRLGEN